MSNLEKKNYSCRTSPIYDDRDGDVIRRLDVKFIRVCEGNAPNAVFFLIPTVTKPVEPIEVDLNVEGYVRLASLPEELRAKVQEVLKPVT